MQQDLIKSDELQHQQLVVVLGMHRSGTSAITRGLQTMGIVLGDRFEPPTIGVNDKGYWEDIDLVSLNDEMLNLCGRNWHSLDPIQPIDVDLLCDRGYLIRAVEMLRNKLADHARYGFKDPRTAMMLPFWVRVFVAGDFNVRYILALRNPLSIVKSLVRRDHFDAEKSYVLWIDHVLSSLSHVNGQDIITMDYDQLMRAPEDELQRLAAWLDADLDPKELALYCGDFLDKGLRHSRFEPGDVYADVAAPALAKEIYGFLVDVLSGRVEIGDAVASGSLKQWIGELERQRPMLRLIDKQEKDLREGKVQLMSLNQAVVERDDQIASLNTVVAERDNQITILNQAVVERDDQITILSQAVVERDAQIASLNTIVAERDNQITILNQAVVERDDQIASLNIVVAERNNQITILNQEVGERNWTISCLSHSIADIRGSTSWRMTAPMRGMITKLRKARSVFSILPQIFQKGGGLLSTSCKAARIFHKEGVPGVKERVRFVFRQSRVTTDISSASIIESSIIAANKLSIVPYYIDPSLDSDALECSHSSSIAIHLHLYYLDMLKEFAGYLNNMPVQYDLYVSVPDNCDAKSIKAELNELLFRAKNIIVEQVPNRGRDIAPLIVQFGNRLTKYEIVGHFHAKKSLHNNNLSGWCQEIMVKLFGPAGSKGGRIDHIINLLQTTAKIVYPEGQDIYIKDSSGWADNYELAKNFLEKYTNISIQDFPAIEFPEGSMFWARADCLKYFLTLPLNYDDFPIEPIAADATLAHALERLILVFAASHDGQCVRIHERDSIADFRHYEIQHDYSSSIMHSDIKVLSYYLPQFHPIPENDLWHGKGFTEWTKVKGANPLFEGHYQQHIPHSDIGYYLLDSPDTLRRQADLMHKSGIYGQVFYHYWFSGKLILEEPAHLLLNTPDIRMPFCFCWANENWTRRWDGNESEILLEQKYSAQDAQDFICYLMPFFKDSRYIKIDGRPVLFVYRPSSIPNSRGYLDIWERECAQSGIKRPYVVAVLTRGATNPADFGMDAGVERVLHDWTAGSVPEIKDRLTGYAPINGSVLSYDDVVDFYISQNEEKNFTYFRSTVPIWDNTARYGSEAFLLHGSTPQRFQEWMESTIDYTQVTLPPDRRLVLVNAWNEWAEGAHLEPDTRYGYSYLNSVGRALSGIVYPNELNPNVPISSDTRIHISIPDFVLSALRKDSDLEQRFVTCILMSSIFDSCQVSIDATNSVLAIQNIQQMHPDQADFVLEFRHVVYFDPYVIEKMLQTAVASGSAVISNSYDEWSHLIGTTANGSVDASVPYNAPMLLTPRAVYKTGYRNIRMRTDAHCFRAYPNLKADADMPVVTTIIRFHKSGNLTELRNALHCLYAMRDCTVILLIAAQDLSMHQIEDLNKMLNGFIWRQGYEPEVRHYRSHGGMGDLRSKMLNESLKSVRTQYAAFLDFDDLLMPYAYSWLIDRLEKTGKAVSFGRVYSTSYDSKKELFIERNRVYEYGYSYREFVHLNHAPIHSFMLNMEKLDLRQIVSFDDQRFMEDYLLTLQLFTQDNADWDSLKENFYIGDYIHSVDRTHTLALTDDQERQSLLSSPEYVLCQQRINDIRNNLKF